MKPSTEYSKEAHDIVGELGLPVPQRMPDSFLLPYRNALGDVQTPADISIVPSDDLGDMLAYWSGMQNFVEYQMATLQIDIDTLKNQTVHTEEELLVGVSAQAINEKKSVTEKKALARKNPKLMEMRHQLNRLKAVHTIFSSLSSSYERGYNTVSREIARRGASNE